MLSVYVLSVVHSPLCCLWTQFGKCDDDDDNNSEMKGGRGNFPHKHERVAVQSSTKRPGFVFLFCVLPRVKPQHVKVNVLADRPIACRNPSIEHTQPGAESGTGTDNPLESFVPVLRSCWQKHKSVDTLCTSPSFRTHQYTIQQV